MGETKEKKNKPSKFKSLQAEFKKIVWPDKMTLAKQSTAVISITVLLGVVITIADIVIKYGIDLLVK
ncbi:preprotein translocase subunit SecE [Lachnospiraceae bacterium OttesenSCG-928-E19]|nr:preprotein translocase subunit SecE [Lachnospiraceae bacterium OttesenSCG-928-E19]